MTAVSSVAGQLDGASGLAHNAGISDLYNSALTDAQKAQVNNGIQTAKGYAGAAIAIAIVVVLIALIVALWFIWDAKEGVVRNLRLWIPLILFFTFLIDRRLFLLVAVFFILFTLWYYVTSARKHEDRVLAYGCDYRKKLEECGCEREEEHVKSCDSTSSLSSKW